MTVSTNPTPTLRLSRPRFDSDPWHDDVNSNFAKIDAAMASIAAATIDYTWATGLVVAQGDRVYDAVDPLIYEANTAHTTGSTTFDDDRVAHPSYWTPITTGLAPRGGWLTTTRYRINDLVYFSGSQYICKVDHVAGVFATDLAAVKWEVFAQQGSPGVGSGNVTGPVSSVANRLAIFADATGMTIADAGVLLSAIALLASPTFTGVPAGPTAALGTNTTQLATTAFVKAAVDALIASSPGALDTLNELAAALGNDANFATTVTNALALKAPLANPALTGNPTAPTASALDNDTSIATTAFVQQERKTRVTVVNAPGGTPTYNIDQCDMLSLTGVAAAITSMTTNLSGTPYNGQKLIVRLKDDGTARAITWGASFEAAGVALPTTTVISKKLTVGFIYDTVTSKFGCVASAQEA